MVDYSKWNNFDLDSTDSDSEEDNGVRVTKLDQPSKITTSKNGDVVIENQPKVKTKSINALMNKSSSVVGQTFEFDDMPSPPSSQIPPNCPQAKKWGQLRPNHAKHKLKHKTLLGSGFHINNGPRCPPAKHGHQINQNYPHGQHQHVED